MESRAAENRTVSPAAPMATREPEAELAALRRRLEIASSIGQLSSIVTDAQRLSRVHPGIAELRYVGGEAAYRASDWRRAADLLLGAGAPPDDRPELQFYLSVALFELGDRDRAAATLRRALPHLQRTPIVERYRRDILREEP